MIRRAIRICAAISIILFLAVIHSAHAVIILGNPGRDLTPPSGTLLNSGWQYEGNWHNFTGTAISPHDFITAAHVGGYPGEAFVYRGESYRAVEPTVLPGTDICIWRVSGNMPAWSPLYQGSSEAGHKIIIYGRGTTRGRAIKAAGALRGWNWGTLDGRLSWGISYVRAVFDTTTIKQQASVSIGQCLVAPFDADVGPHAGCVSGGDSGGGVFLKDDDNVWKLAGVVYGVDSGLAPSMTSKSSFSAALFDTRGLFRLLDNGRHIPIPATLPNPLPTDSLISRLSVHLPAIQHAIDSNVQIRHVLRYFALAIILPFFVIAAAIFNSFRSARLHEKVIDTKKE